MIYTKTSLHHGLILRDFFKDLKEAKLEPNSVYWYHQHDKSKNTLFFNDFIDDDHWNHLRNDPTSKILLFYPDEYFSLEDVNEWTTVIKERDIPHDQFYIIVTDNNWVKWTKSIFKENGVELTNIQDYNLLMKNVQKQTPVNEFNYRFSALSRNYTLWRLKLFLELQNNSSLKKFNYTFNNMNPYEQQIISIEQVMTDAKNLGFELNENLKNWIINLPYSLNAPINAKLADETYSMIKSSAINIVIESHYTPFFTPYESYAWMHPGEFSPSFPTEKIYKAIACLKPFIVYTTPYFLHEFRQLGYQTFSHVIDESYDNIIDNNERFDAIIKEISRLSSMHNTEFNKIIKECSPQNDFNFRMMEKRRSEISLNDNFSWLREFSSC